MSQDEKFSQDRRGKTEYSPVKTDKAGAGQNEREEDR